MTVDEPEDFLVAKNTRGETVDTMLSLPMGETLRFAARGGTGMMQVFAAEPSWTVGTGGRIYFGMSSDYAIRAYDRTGKLTAILRRKVDRRAVTDEDKQALMNVFRKAASDAGARPEQLSRIESAIGFAENFPAFAALLGGPSGTLWVQRILAATEIQSSSDTIDPLEMGGPEWDVYDADLKLLGTMVMPKGFTPLRWIGDRLAGISVGSSGAQQVMILLLRGV
jgi:hypothetical protein